MSLGTLHRTLIMYQGPSFIMGVASFIMGVASFIMGVASFIMGVASFMGWIGNCSVNTYCTVYLSYYATYHAGFCSYWVIVSSAVVLLHARSDYFMLHHREKNALYKK